MRTNLLATTVLSVLLCAATAAGAVDLKSGLKLNGPAASGPTVPQVRPSAGPRLARPDFAPSRLVNIPRLHTPLDAAALHDAQQGRAAAHAADAAGIAQDVTRADLGDAFADPMAGLGGATDGGPNADRFARTWAALGGAGSVPDQLDLLPDLPDDERYADQAGLTPDVDGALGGIAAMGGGKPAAKEPPAPGPKGAGKGAGPVGVDRSGTVTTHHPAQTDPDGTVTKRLTRVHPTGTVEQETRVITPGGRRENTRITNWTSGERSVRVWDPDTGKGVLTRFNRTGTVNFVERTTGSGERTRVVVHGFERLLTGDEDGGDVWCPPSMRGCSGGELEVDPIPAGPDRVLPPRGDDAADAPAAPRLVLSEQDLLGNPDPHALPGGGGGVPARYLDRGRLVNPGTSD